MRVGRLAERLGVALRGDPDVEITHCGDLQNAGNGSLCFVASKRYISDMLASSASAVIVPDELASGITIPILVSSNPYLMFAKAASILHPPAPVLPGIDSSAQIHQDCIIENDVAIAANVVISAPCQIGRGSYIGPNSVISAPLRLGEDSRLLAAVTVCGPTRTGARLLVHPGVVIGSDGFGLANEEGRWIKIPQLGEVVIGDDVEIGANTTIDRGALKNTQIGDGVKIDNQVQIAHNVQIGANTAIAGCVGIAGSAIIGANCAIGGGAGIQGHITIADGVQVTGMTKISQSISRAGSYSSGTVAQENHLWLRNVTRFKQLDIVFKRLSALERKLRDR